MTQAESNTPEFSVSELSNTLKRTVEDAFGHVRVRGELGRVTTPRSGHVYLDLKDEKSVLGGVMWKGVAARLNFRPEVGLEVVCEGKLTTYPGQSKYQLVIERMEPAGAGALMALLEERKKKLAAEGLFDTGRKKALPYLPRVIGVVTSPTGAVIRDILHRLGDRFPRHVLVWPVLVQGEGAAAQIAAAIEGFNAIKPGGAVPRPDVLIVARGGGSVEDLWAFNEEAVVRAAAASDIPLISAVGHETDTTLIDFASDRRAPTPTGAAEMAVPVRAELMQDAHSLAGRLIRSLTRLTEKRRTEFRATARAFPTPQGLLGPIRQRLDVAAAMIRPEALRRDLAHRLGNLRAAQSRLTSSLGRQARYHRGQFEKLSQRLGRATPEKLSQRSKDQLVRLADRLVRATPYRVMEQHTMRLDGLSTRWHLAGQRNLKQRRRELNSVAGKLDLLSHQSVLNRGFALVRDGEGKLVRSVQSLSPGGQISIELGDGRKDAVIAGRSPKSRKTPSAETQGKLF